MVRNNAPTCPILTPTPSSEHVLYLLPRTIYINITKRDRKEYSNYMVLYMMARCVTETAIMHDEGIYVYIFT